jgi:poly-gamma-glutamate synthesis protein (capsule biosynthesis protein)
MDPGSNESRHAAPQSVRLFLCGDVMTGRGIDQVLPHPSDPELHESFVRDARQYVELAEQVNGPIPRPVPVSYVWGDALAELDRRHPHARIVNLETSVTTSDTYWRGKAVNYRMQPANVGCLTAARLDVCTLANNHVLDYSREGLVDTLQALAEAGIRTAGAGRTLAEARRAAVVDLPGAGRVLVFSCGAASSGVPPEWAATADRAGVDWLPDVSERAADDLLARVRCIKRPGDITIVSIHWDSNWGYDVPMSHVAFTHRLLDGEVDIVHGHSSHHPRPIELHRGKLALYGCGDFLNDYEGIGGYEKFRSDLVLMYFPTIDTRTGTLLDLALAPMQLRGLRAVHAARPDAEWLRDSLSRSSEPFGSRFEMRRDGAIGLVLTTTPPVAAAEWPGPGVDGES